MANSPDPQPSLRPTAYSTLVVAAMGTAALTLLVVSRFYQNVPELAWYNPVAIGVLAIVLANLAFLTRRRLRRPGEYASVQALQISRFAVLAKAAAIGGAIFLGAYSGFTIWVAAQAPRLDAASSDVPPGILGIIACLALVAAAMWLEYSCRIPDEDDSGHNQSEASRTQDTGD